MKAVLLFISAAAIVGVLAGCDAERKSNKAEKSQRPVVSMVVKPYAGQPLGFAGTIQPRYQTERGFRELGRLVSRRVEVGDTVAPGQILAQIDPLLLNLAVRASEADLAKAQAEFTNSSALEGRRRALFGKNVVAEADFESARQALETAAAGVKQAEANLAKAREQRSYATLTADAVGVVTSVDAEVGQMVAAGKKVMTIARTDIREAVIDIPDAAARALILGAPFAVRLQADQSVTTPGKVREIAPQADQATRTRRIKITLEQTLQPFRLGATVTVFPLAPAAAQTTFDVPASAILNRDGGPRVWLLDPATKTVRTISVQVAEHDDRVARIVGGLPTGARIVIAGVNSLSEGQAVKFDERISP